MEDAFELLAGGGIGENDLCQLCSSQLTVRANNARPERPLDFRQRRLAGRHNLACQIVGIHDRDALRAQDVGGSGLAHANATGKTEGFHRPEFREPDNKPATALFR